MAILLDALKILYRHEFISENSEDKDNRALVGILNKQIKEDNKELARIPTKFMKPM
ncbi:MAG: hypothetical protein PG981_001266 [Wolbachia endosymbiont of Ctenocephalides orientis wCori]|nr:MAG: hypothetical protein PG981_001266 [Wolbachia endosymbiont of Ctenocephalides orientis wCori]